MGQIEEWILDWLDRSDVSPTDRRIDDPIAILQRVFAALAGIIAILTSPAISMLVPHLNPIAAIVLRSAVALVTLLSVNYVVTAKDVVDTTSGFGSRTLRTYRYSTAERIIARGIVLAALLLLVLNLVPASPARRACILGATVDWEPTPSSSPVFLSLSATGSLERYPIEKGKAVAIQVVPEHLSTFSVILEWSDNSRSDFGAFSGCSAVMNRRSVDDRAKIDLAVR